jgi:hypothetical protein
MTVGQYAGEEREIHWAMSVLLSYRTMVGSWGATKLIVREQARVWV